MIKRALIYGINNYKSISDLRGCINDVENVRSLLVDEFEFKSNNIRTRKDEDVTLDRIQRDWEWLINDTATGDQLVFHFSGHGSYVDDLSGDEDDGVDEVLCLYDMDFDDPDSYLSDDKIHEFTNQIPPGVKFTFIFDCCHSGTGTRQIVPRSLNAREAVSGEQLPLIITRETNNRSENVRSMGRSRSARTGRPSGADQVLARFVRPPASAARRLERSGARNVRRLGRSMDEMNHVLFSGCRSDQTSADAYIDDSFQGAFSHYFCKTIRDSGGAVPQKKLIREVRQALGDGNFSQVPQLEPDDVEANVFDAIGDDARTQSSDPRINSDAGSGNNVDLAAITKKLDELVDLLRGLTRGGGRTGGATRASADRGLVFVHGICWHEAGFSNSWFNSLSRHLDDDLRRQLDSNRHEVLWSHHVSSRPGSSQRSSSSRSAEEQRLSDEIADVLKDRADQAMELQISSSDTPNAQTQINRGRLDRALLGIPGLDCVDDFIRYLLNRRTRQNVIDEFLDVVRPRLENGEFIDVISHSWGTVVALEALHQLSEDRFPGRVQNLFTVGAALSIRTIQRRLQFGAETGDKPALVDRWFNLDARGDIVGGTLRRFSSDVEREYLNLDPTGCEPGFFGVSASCAHSSYFQRANHAVNRDIFAHWIQ